jgi:TPR repeat protein
MESEIKEIEDIYNFYFRHEISGEKFIKLFKDDIIEESDDIGYINYIGIYYIYKKGDYDLAEKYLLSGIEKDNVKSMALLGTCYRCMGKYDLMEKYYLMAVEKKNNCAIFSLGCYYERIKDYNLMEKYYLMAIDNGDMDAMYELGYYYLKVKNNLYLAEKYLLMACELNNVSAMYRISTLYYLNNSLEKMKKYATIRMVKFNKPDDHMSIYYNKNDDSYKLRDIEDILKYKIYDINLNIKLLLNNNDLISKYYKYLVKYNDLSNYYDMIKLIYCN